MKRYADGEDDPEADNGARPLLVHRPESTNSSGSADAHALNNLVRTAVSSGPGGAAPEGAGSTVSDSDDVPDNVSTPEQLSGLPEESLSGDAARPLQHYDEDGKIFRYALRPMLYSVTMILLCEGVERFAFYGINYTQTSYLTGAYDDDWNAGMDAIPASSYVSISVAVAYTAPFLGAFLADQVLGDYWTILSGTIFFYLPGLLLIALTTIPGFLGKEFNQSALAFGLLFLWPTGTGIVKSAVNVFGAKQFHPLLQSSLIESYYVNFYMCINVGALIGGVLVPVLAQRNVTIAYFLPVGLLTISISVFVLGSSRYVRSTPSGGGWKALFGKKKKTPSYAINNTGDPITITHILRIALLIVPFSIVYSQMSTTFIVQGTVMHKAFGLIDAATMNNADAVAVLIFGHFIGNILYPWIADRGIKIPTTYKFAIGSAFGAASIAWALYVEHKIIHTYAQTGERVNILWQAVSYILIGVGEIFAVSAAYEVAFTASPPEKKVLFSAMNLFCIGGLPNIICIGLYQACVPWFQNSEGTTKISHISEYASAHVNKYFWLLFVISVAGTFLNLIPAVKDFVEAIEDRATDMIRTPKTPMRPPKRESLPQEESELLKARRHQYYLKYGSGPSIYKQGSMRAGHRPSARGSAVGMRRPSMQRNMLSTLYRSDPAKPGVGVGAILRPGVGMQGSKAGGRPNASALPTQMEESGHQRSTSK